MPFRFPLEPALRVSDIFFRAISGFFGGLFGSMVILIVLLVGGTLGASYLAPSEEGTVTPILVFVTLIAIYLASLISSLSSITFFYYCDRERYTFLLSTLTHVFALITLLFVVSTPLSILISVKSYQSLSIVGLLFIGLTTIFSVVVQEVVANHKHLLLTLYSSAIALFTFFLLMFIVYFLMGAILSDKTTSYLFIMALPLCWGSFGFWQVSFEMIYQWLYELYGSDFLNSTTRVGSDYIKEQRMQR